MLTTQDIKILKETFFDLINVRLGAVDKRFDAIDLKFSEIDKRFDVIDLKFSEIDRRFDDIESRLFNHNQRIMSVQDTVVGIDKYLKEELAVNLLALEKTEGDLNRRIIKLERRLS
ncbi:MAG TPA: hypothetical protein PLV59_01630 [Candidatus Dojkabacteria bacterium]|nr:hypothetical protein [Candidatus Dojkabacteria bacterium]